MLKSLWIYHFIWVQFFGDKTFGRILKSTKREILFLRYNILPSFKSLTNINKEYIHMPVMYSYFYTELSIAPWTYAYISIYTIIDIYL